MLLNIYLFKLVLTSLKLFLSVFRYTEIYAEFKGKFNFYKSLPTYWFTNHFHVGVHGFCRKGITAKNKIFILCETKKKYIHLSKLS